MNVKTKFPRARIICGLLVLFLLLISSAAYSDAPGVTAPRKKAPARAAVNKRKPAPAKKSVKAPAAKPVVTVITPLNEAVGLIKQKRYKQALPYILRAICDQPENPDVWYWFGVWNDKTGNFANAQKYFTKALAIDHDYPALSRVVIYPGDPYKKIPLWDSVRDTYIEPISPMEEDVEVIAPGSPESMSEQRPEEMPVIPETPVYLPPVPENESEE